MLRNLLVMACCAAVIMSAAFVPVSAEGEIVINGNEIATFKNRTKEQIFSLWQDAEIKDFDSIFEEGKEPSYTAPYSGGTVKQEVLQNVRKNLNYYRFLVGSPEITEEFTNQPQLQNASVLQTINLRDWDNGVGLTHSLWDYPKPDDMDQSFYDSAVFANHNIFQPTVIKALSGDFSERAILHILRVIGRLCYLPMWAVFKWDWETQHTAVLPEPLRQPRPLRKSLPHTLLRDISPNRIWIYSRPWESLKLTVTVKGREM